MNKRLIILLVWSFNFFQFTTLQAQSIETSADSIYLCGNDTLALKEYLRAFVITPTFSSEVLPLKISRLYRQFGNYDKSIQFADIYYFTTQNPSNKDKALIEKIQIYFSIKDFNQAQLVATQLSGRSAGQLDTKYFYLGMCQLMKNEWTSARSDFSKISYVNDSTQIAINQLIDKAEKIGNQDVTWSMYMSAVVPGLGQAVNGDLKDGLNSFLLIGTLFVTFLQISNTLTFSDAVVSVGPWGARYFIGGLTNAVNAANKAKQRKIDMNAGKVVDVLKGARMKHRYD